MSLWDSFGEKLGGVTDAVLAGGNDLLSAWVSNKSDEIQSAAPEENRPPVRPAEQPNGAPVQPDYRGALAQLKPLLYGGGALMLLMFVLAMYMGRGR
ncbi:hypothetical protein [Enterovibrio paralichthyis]|uniref:hypothetical protein n=1 Tax=Enterovibrio paralichthyis TaxID=2853805 RepID=UPI0006D03A5B|nr:hypothetical protein [Enterovibrio paralichthyis]MBV7296826.1 hypothetical protein [Enterovibrio paralichthyis]